MDGQLFLGIARFLSCRTNDEAASRTAIGRAYYASFLAARKVAFDATPPELWRKAGIKNERGIRHKNLQDYLTGSSEEDVQRLGEDLAGLRGDRDNADYVMSESIVAADAQNAIEHAEAFLQDLRRTKPSVIRQAVETEITKLYP
jgi:uncharacterized protein (UPF0332 family)